MEIVAGACYSLDHGQPDRHFFFVISDPSRFPAHELVLVPLTSCSPDKSEDGSCKVHPGEHPCCVKASFVFYRGAIFLTPARLLALLNAGKAFPKPPALSEDLLARMRQGAERSDELAQKYREVFWQQGIVDSPT